MDQFAEISALIVALGGVYQLYRIHHAARASGLDSTMLVSVAESGDWTVAGPGSRLGRAMARIRPHAATGLRALLRTENPIIHSPAIVPSGWPKRLNGSDADVIHLHWAGWRDAFDSRTGSPMGGMKDERERSVRFLISVLGKGLTDYKLDRGL